MIRGLEGYKIWKWRLCFEKLVDRRWRQWSRWSSELLYLRLNCCCFFVYYLNRDNSARQHPVDRKGLFVQGQGRKTWMLSASRAKTCACSFERFEILYRTVNQWTTVLLNKGEPWVSCQGEVLLALRNGMGESIVLSRTSCVNKLRLCWLENLCFSG